jgi:hypothetical protein
MSVGISKSWKIWRNQAASRGKQKGQAEELKKRFGHRSGPAPVSASGERAVVTFEPAEARILPIDAGQISASRVDVGYRGTLPVDEIPNRPYGAMINDRGEAI